MTNNPEGILRSLAPVIRRRGALAALLLALLPAVVEAQPGSNGWRWSDFGPSGSNGSFVEITRVHTGAISAYAVAADPQNRVVTLNEWQDAEFDLTLDCAVTRHLQGARTLDMDFTGELEATRRIALDLGGGVDDRCLALDIDSVSRPVIAGYASTDGPDTAFVVRLRATDGDYDTTFSSNGKFTLENLIGFAGSETRFTDVETYPDRRIVACGWVERGGERNMLVMRFLASGALDAGFNGSGYREIDFNGLSGDNDTCERLLILPDERLVLAGTANTPSTGEVGYALVRLHGDGSPDTSFSFDGKVVVTDGSALTAPVVVDVGYDATRQRLLVAANATGLNLTPAGALVAVGNAGTLDASFNGTGRRTLRFSDFGAPAPARDPGATSLRRLLMRPDGSFYLAGTHSNSVADAATWGPTDVALARLRADGSDDAGAAVGFSTDGIAFYAYPGLGHDGVDPESRLRVGDILEDAIVYRGNVLLLSETNRHPEGVWGGASWDLGPIAPVLAGIVTDRIWHEDFEPDGLAEPTSLYASIPVPAGYGRYCSVRDPISGGFGLIPQGAASDPCQDALDSDPDLIVDRAGLYSISGPNNVLATCAGGYVGLHPGNGGAPFDAALAAASGRTDCVFTAAPVALPVFSRPYTGEHLATSAQSFNHDAFWKPIDVSDFGQTPDPGHPLAHYIDLNGVQKCDDTYGHVTGWGPYGGVDEAAADIGVTSDRHVVAVAAGRVAAAVPRYALQWSPVGGDPHQREVFVRHTIGTGRYSEQFTTYYAHMSDTLVRRGDAVVAGTPLGRVGTTGASGGEHLHIAVFRHKNLSYRSSFELDYSRADFFELGKELAAIDPWGWRGPQALDPWAWRFKFNDGDLPDYAGSWSIDLWKAGEAPTMDGYSE